MPSQMRKYLPGRTVVESLRHLDRDRIDSAYRRTLARLSQAN